jgi:pimeloyl-ACP methyl ester carboxylesterase
VEGAYPVEHGFIEAGDIRMHFVEAGKGDPVVMLHGWPQHWYLWRDVIPLMAPHWRVICPDLRGFGWTEAPGSGYDRETMARDVLALIEALGLERVRLMGHDWGGWIGFLLCLHEPELFERFVDLNMLPPWPSRNPRDLLELWRLGYQVALGLPQIGRRAAAPFARLAMRGDSDAVQVFTSRLDGDRARASELIYRTFLLREAVPMAAGRYSADDLQVPTLMLFGERDPVIPTRMVREQAAASDVIELELVPDAGHFIVDEKPELVADRALRFFAG